MGTRSEFQVVRQWEEVLADDIDWVRLGGGCLTCVTRPEAWEEVARGDAISC